MAGDVVLIGSYDAHLYGVDVKTGKERWKVLTNGQVHATPAVQDGLAFIAGCDSILRAIRIELFADVERLSERVHAGAVGGVHRMQRLDRERHTDHFRVVQQFADTTLDLGPRQCDVARGGPPRPPDRPDAGERHGQRDRHERREQPAVHDPRALKSAGHKAGKYGHEQRGDRHAGEVTGAARAVVASAAHTHPSAPARARLSGATPDQTGIRGIRHEVEPRREPEI